MPFTKAHTKALLDSYRKAAHKFRNDAMVPAWHQSDWFDLAKATDEVIAHFEMVLAESVDPIKSPPGWYTKVRVTSDTASDEWTNVGIICFDGRDRQQTWAKIGPYGRAFKRETLKREWLHGLANYPQRFQTTGDVERALETDGHHMGRVQVTPLLSCVVDQTVYWDAYARLVLGIKTI